MKLVLYGDNRLGVFENGRVFDVMDALRRLPRHTPQEMMEAVIAHWDKLRPRLQEATQDKPGVPIEQVHLLPPVPKPSKILCFGINFLEFGRRPPADMNVFLKASSSLIGSGGTVVLPPANADLFYHEAELGIVIGKPMSKATQNQALESIFGYVNFLDLTARGLNPSGRQSLFLGKCWDTFAPTGPFLVTADEVGDPLKLQVKLWVNGILRQDFPMSDIAYGVPELIEFCSGVTSLEVGDVIATGTNHTGLGAIQDNDLVEMEIEPLGKLWVRVQDPLKRTWPREPYADLLENALSVGHT